MGINSPNYELKSVRILHVDDEEFFLEASNVLLHTFLEKFNIDLITLDSVESALELLDNEDFDVIISDYQMPTIDGLEFLAKLREMNNTTPFIILTGRGREEIVIKALNLGADYYIQKGLDINLLFTELSHYITVLFDKKREKLRRKIAEKELYYRVSYEDIISSLSTHFINLTYQEIDNAILTSLKEIIRFENYDCCAIIQLDKKKLIMSFSLPKDEFKREIPIENIEDYSYVLNLIKDSYSLHIINIDRINENARSELELIGFKNYPSLLGIPLTEDESPFGMLIFGSKQSNRHWTENSILFLRMIGEMISRALLKKKLENEIMTQEKEMKKYLTNLQYENENFMAYLLEINNNIKEYLQKEFKLSNFNKNDTINLNNLLNDLQKEFKDLKISFTDFPTIYGNYGSIYDCFKLLFKNATSFKHSNLINISKTLSNEMMELHISSDSLNIFYDIPSALNDISSTKQYQLLLTLKNLLILNNWNLEISERPKIVFIIKNINLVN